MRRWYGTEAFYQAATWKDGAASDGKSKVPLWRTFSARGVHRDHPPSRFPPRSRYIDFLATVCSFRPAKLLTDLPELADSCDELDAVPTNSRAALTFTGQPIGNERPHAQTTRVRGRVLAQRIKILVG